MVAQMDRRVRREHIKNENSAIENHDSSLENIMILGRPGEPGAPCVIYKTDDFLLKPTISC